MDPKHGPRNWPKKWTPKNNPQKIPPNWTPKNWTQNRNKTWTPKTDLRNEPKSWPQVMLFMKLRVSCCARIQFMIDVLVTLPLS